MRSAILLGRKAFNLLTSQSVLWGKARRCLLIFLGGSTFVMADNGWERAHFSFLWDNDATYGTDRHYTQGAQISYFSADDALPHWLEATSDALPAVGFQTAARKWGLNLGQQIFTPAHLNGEALIKDDRPYAAWLYAGLKLQRRGQGSWPVAETLRLEAGLVGPEALGKQAQRIVHAVEPKGWKNELRTEPGILLNYDRRYLYRHTFADGGLCFDFIPNLGASVGNILTFANAGATARFGWNIPNEFETPKAPTAFRYGGYVFAGVEGRAFARNIFLDGNTWRESHHVDKKPLVGDARIGIALVLKRFEFVVSQTFRSREFDTQEHNDSFGTAMILVKF